MVTDYRLLVKRGLEDEAKKLTLDPYEIAWVQDKRYAIIGLEDGTPMKLDQYMSFVIENNLMEETLQHFISRMERMISSGYVQEAAEILLCKFKVLCPDISANT